MKAESNMLWVVISLILVIAIIMLGFNFLYKGSKENQKIIDLFSEDNSCKNLGQNQKMTGGEFIDIDSDLRPDYCDICVCESDSCNNDNDADFDKIPDGCDLDKENSKIGMCSVNEGCSGIKCCSKDSSCGTGGTVKSYVDSFRCVISWFLEGFI